MRFRLPIAILALTAMTACGGFSSRLNPFKWFKRSTPVEVVTTETPADPRPLVANVLSMQIDSYPGGAIVRATGLPPTQGYWSAELVPQPLDENGTLVLQFHVFPPEAATAVVNQQSREITVAYNLSDIKLQQINQIVVQGASNARASSR
ncbi:MAG: hypothetical protein U1A24_01975 [Cypionkella sp.]|uniref:hypothetical protein n=1 Tax=Cypionkella sp. TaxID=2811411 RepID=UPI002ABA497C|nr:hypothetical protein [Cypionkella sp.]MDZ4309317.1 hypothetical protein [Cypionkella sp.]